MRILKKGNSNTKSLAYISLVRPIIEYGAVCWNPDREGQISALDRVKKKTAKFAHYTNVRTGKLWRRVESYHAMCPLQSVLWRTDVEGYRLLRPHYLSGVDHERKIGSRRQRTDIGKYSFVNRTIQHWNQLPADVLETQTCKQITFKQRVRKVIIEMS
jgi:hypothetical protein